MCRNVSGSIRRPGSGTGSAETEAEVRPRLKRAETARPAAVGSVLLNSINRFFGVHTVNFCAKKANFCAKLP